MEKPLGIDDFGVIVYGKLRIASRPAHLAGMVITAVSQDAAAVAIAAACPRVHHSELMNQKAWQKQLRDSHAWGWKGFDHSAQEQTSGLAAQHLTYCKQPD